MKNSDMPAMPILNDWDGFSSFLEGVKGGRNYGLTKREELAGRAMQGILGNQLSIDNYSVGNIAELSVLQADALLKELEK